MNLSWQGSRITCPVLVGVGAIDETCPPEGVIAAFNQIPSPKQLVVEPGANHGGAGNTHAPYYLDMNNWLHDLHKGKPAPVGKWCDTKSPRSSSPWALSLFSKPRIGPTAYVSRVTLMATTSSAVS